MLRTKRLQMRERGYQFRKRSLRRWRLSQRFSHSTPPLLTWPLTRVRKKIKGRLHKQTLKNMAPFLILSDQILDALDQGSSNPVLKIRFPVPSKCFCDSTYLSQIIRLLHLEKVLHLDGFEIETHLKGAGDWASGTETKEPCSRCSIIRCLCKRKNEKIKGTYLDF